MSAPLNLLPVYGGCGDLGWNQLFGWQLLFSLADAPFDVPCVKIPVFQPAFLSRFGFIRNLLKLESSCIRFRGALGQGETGAAPPQCLLP